MLKMYGPYLRKDGRKHILWVDTVTRKQTTESYPRFLMSQYLGRKLEKYETVDHINNDHTDDRIENLQLLSLADNIRKSAPKRKTFTFRCPWCKNKVTKYMNQIKHNKKQGKKGPYCSRSCAAKATYVNPWRDK
jgi:hypothetical protein